MAFDGLDELHIGRSFTSHELEDDCPCPQMPCGLVRAGSADPSCTEHPITASKTIRRSHPPTRCPGAPS